MTEDNLTTTTAAPGGDDAAQLRESIAKLEAKNRELKAEKDRLRASATELEELRAFRAEQERQQLESRGQYDQARQQLQQQYDTDTAALRQQVEQLQGRIRELELVMPASSTLASVVHDPEDVWKTGRLRPDQIEATPDGPVVVDGLTRTPIADWARSNLPAHYLKAPRPQGTGAPAGSGQPVAVPAGMKNPFSREHFNLTEQANLYRTNPALYAQLKAAAGK